MARTNKALLKERITWIGQAQRALSGLWRLPTTVWDERQLAWRPRRRDELAENQLNYWRVTCANMADIEQWARDGQRIARSEIHRLEIERGAIAA